MALASFGQVVVGVAGIAKEAYELYKSLKAGFASSAISRSELRAAEDIFENYPLERWDEELVVETILDIDMDDLEFFVLALKLTLHVGHEVDPFKQLKYHQAHQVMVQKISYRQDFNMKFGQIAMIRDGEKFSCAIAFSSVNFKLKDKCVRGWIWDSYEPVSLTAREVNLITETYVPHLALKSFKNKGLVDRIEYVND